MKKYLIMLLAAAMGMLMLTACGDYDNDNPGGTLSTTPSTPTGGLQSGLNGIGSDISKGLDEFGGAVSGAFTSMTNDSGISSVPTEPTMPTDTSDSIGTDVSEDPTNGADDNDTIPSVGDTDNPNGGNAESPAIHPQASHPTANHPEASLLPSNNGKINLPQAVLSAGD